MAVTKTSVPSIKKNLCEMKRLLVDDQEKRTHKIRFKRAGRRYMIIDNGGSVKNCLEKSFNDFMSKLDVKEDGKKMRGLLFLDKQSDAFSIGYQREGEQVLHQIKGRLG
jgi:hypothetical protein